MIRRISVILAVLIASTKASARDTYLLMLASQVDYMRSAVADCAVVLPGYAERFAEADKKASNGILKREGIEALIAEARSTPELDPTVLLAKLRAASKKDRHAWCQWNLEEMRSLAEIELK